MPHLCILETHVVQARFRGRRLRSSEEVPTESQAGRSDCLGCCRSASTNRSNDTAEGLHGGKNPLIVVDGKIERPNC